MTLPVYPLIRSKTDIDLFKRYFSDAIGTRISLFTAGKYENSDFDGLTGQRWLDLSLDFVSNLLSESGSEQNKKEKKYFIEQCKGTVFLDRSGVPKKTNANTLHDSVAQMFELARKYKPNMIGIPQFPYDAAKGTSKANRSIVNAIQALSPKISLVVPVVIQHRNWTQSKPRRREIVDDIKNVCSSLKPDYLWVVDGSLNDDEGSGTLAKERLPNLVKLHKEIRAVTNGTKIIAGPYWGMNLVLWARGLADYIAITPGGSSQYYAECGVMKYSASVRLSLPPLRRLVKKSPELKPWLKKVSELSLPSAEATEQFQKLEREFQKLEGEIAKRQIADFYSIWLKRICSLPAQGRAFGLYQDLSAAYALGSLLPKLEAEKGVGANASHVAEALMLNVLG